MREREKEIEREREREKEREREGEIGRRLYGVGGSERACRTYRLHSFIAL